MLSTEIQLQKAQATSKPLAPRVSEDPFRGSPHILVLAESYNAWDGQPAIGNTNLGSQISGLRRRVKTQKALTLDLGGASGPRTLASRK